MQIFTHKTTNLEKIIVGHVCGETCDGLTTRASDSHQQGVTARLFDDTRHSRHMLNSKSEQHQVHRLPAHVVKLLEISLHNVAEILKVSNLNVASGVRLGIWEVAVDQRTQIVLCYLEVEYMIRVSQLIMASISIISRLFCVLNMILYWNNICQIEKRTCKEDGGEGWLRNMEEGRKSCNMWRRRKKRRRGGGREGGVGQEWGEEKE